MRRNGAAGISWGTAPRLRNNIRLQADMRAARAALIAPHALECRRQTVNKPGREEFEFQKQKCQPSPVGIL